MRTPRLTRTLWICCALALSTAAAPRPGALEAGSGAFFVRGDANSDAARDISDAIYLLRNLFVDGPPPLCADAADVNDDGQVDNSDPVMLVWFLFQGTAAPPSPGGECGPDPTGDDLGCELYAPCPTVDFSSFVLDLVAQTADDTEPVSLAGLNFRFTEDAALFEEVFAP
jgi:hypothetical protein